jgi:hypothetical protein
MGRVAKIAGPGAGLGLACVLFAVAGVIWTLTGNPLIGAWNVCVGLMFVVAVLGTRADPAAKDVPPG